MMDRRELLMGATAVAVAALSGKALAAQHDHAGMAHAHATATRNENLLAAAADCVLKANICLQHCITSLGEGDRTLEACAKASSEVIAMCTALQQMAAAQSKYLPQLARVCMDVCKACEEECKKTEKHPECKACKEACAVCYKECKAIAA
ncbi:MAG: hypothetical protein Fur0040_00310 [Sideroxydans sp.]